MVCFFSAHGDDWKCYLCDVADVPEGCTDRWRHHFPELLDEFKRDLPKGILLSAIYEAFLVGILAIILGGYTYYAAEPWIGAVYMFAAVLAFVWLGMMLYDFSILFGKKMKVKTHFGLSFVLCLQHLPITFVMVVSLGAAVIVSEIFPLFMLFLPAGFCWLMNKWLLKIENRHAELLGNLNTPG